MGHPGEAYSIRVTAAFGSPIVLSKSVIVIPGCGVCESAAILPFPVKLNVNAATAKNLRPAKVKGELRIYFSPA